MALLFVNDQTPEICLAAVQQTYRAFKFVNRQTPDICLTAVRQSGLEIEYVYEQTEEICLAAVQQNGISLRYVKTQTYAICLAAVQQNGFAVGFIDTCIINDIDKIYLAAVNQYGPVYNYIPYKHRSPEICHASILATRRELWSVRERTNKICVSVAIEQKKAEFSAVLLELSLLPPMTNGFPGGATYNSSKDSFSRFLQIN